MATNAKQAFAAAVKAQRAATPPVVPHIIGGKERFDGPRRERVDPSYPDIVVSASHDATDEAVNEAVAASRKAQRIWAKVPLAERLERMRPALASIESNTEEWAVRVALEIGKPYEGARGEGAEIYDMLKHLLEYAEVPGAFKDERAADPSGMNNDSVLKPYGVFGVIVPFNYPIVQGAGPAIGALIAGNGVVVKTSQHAPWSGQAVYEFCAAMDLPEGLVNIVHGGGRALAASDIDGVSFTGSVEVGRSIMTQFGSGAYPRPVIAEMGGKNPVIVTDDADLDQAADGIVFSAFDLTGQKCSALSRVLVMPGVHDQLVDLVENKVRKLFLGDPIDGASYAGPVVSTEAVERYHALMKVVDADGFRVAQGRAAEGGYAVPATVVSDVPFTHDLATIEHFLPFLTISKVEDFEEAITVANATDMGLTAGIYTGDVRIAEEFLDRIEAGCADVNVPGHATTGWWPGPQTFGGWKGSGSTGKHTLGKWYAAQFGRQQARTVPSHFNNLLTH
ncbi:MAG: aldehyde dehydrogenase family protein [Gulosibacter sp.]|uniref:aldehyde dehydrogenase family protein n=1 Tax=Gulosibacter sp. TaxID=2817531 RepID=UPI003F92FEF2